MRISDWSSDVCSSDLPVPPRAGRSLVFHLPQELAVDVAEQAVAVFDAVPALRLIGDGKLGAARQGADRLRFRQGLGPNIGIAEQDKERVIFAGCGPIDTGFGEIGRASCRERVCRYV